MFNPTGAFEEHNLPTDPTKVLLRHDGKYYLIYLQDSNHKPYIIKRNYEYKIIIDKLDPSYGKAFEPALKGAPVNNPWIRVEQIIPGVTDGNYELAIVGGTYKSVNKGVLPWKSFQDRKVQRADPEFPGYLVYRVRSGQEEKQELPLCGKHCRCHR